MKQSQLLQLAANIAKKYSSTESVRRSDVIRDVVRTKKLNLEDSLIMADCIVKGMYAAENVSLDQGDYCCPDCIEADRLTGMERKLRKMWDARVNRLRESIAQPFNGFEPPVSREPQSADTTNQTESTTIVKCADCGRLDGYHEKGCSGWYGL